MSALYLPSSAALCFGVLLLHLLIYIYIESYQDPKVLSLQATHPKSHLSLWLVAATVGRPLARPGQTTGETERFRSGSLQIYIYMH